MIKILSGWSGPGGSTVAFNNLVNLFNSKGLDACFYSPSKWEGVTCKWGNSKDLNLKESDTFIYHFVQVNDRPPVRKCVLSCHETSVFHVSSQSDLKYDDIHFVSEFQKQWQQVDGTVIPNVIPKYSKVPRVWKNNSTAGVIGSIDANKRTHLSIQRALDDGHEDIRIYGAITEYPYFHNEVLPLLGDKVSYRGVALDMQLVYDTLTDVYHSPLLETFNLIKAECEVTDVYYHGEEGNDTQAEYWDHDKVFEAWKDLLECE